MYSSWKELEETKYVHKFKSGFIYISEVTDDLETPPRSVIDICFFDAEKDEHQILDLMPWKNILELPIRKSIKIKEEELLAHIFWEIAGPSKSLTQVKDSFKNKRKIDWKEIEKDLGDLYN